MNFSIKNEVLDPIVLLEQNFEKFQERPALLNGRQSISYGNLKFRVHAVARWLKSLEIASGARVGIAVDEPLPFCELLLAVAWVGAVYVPLEISAFPERARAMIDGAAVSIVICDNHTIAAFCKTSCIVATIPEAWPDGHSEINPVERPGNAAFNIMFTSGSSGTPKGVICPAGGVIPLVCGSCHIPLLSSDRVLQVSARSFDAFTWELWGSLLNGACLVLTPAPWSIRSLGKFIASEGITAAFFTSRLFDALIDAEFHSLRHMRLIAFGGENASLEHSQRAVALLPAVQIVNVYGPSENTTFTSSHLLDHTVANETRVPIGKPAGGDVTYLVSPATDELIDGPGRGELVVGGPGLAIGYTDPVLTSKRFMTHEALGLRLFRTGDLVERDASGRYTWLGRLDREVKVRGRRVDLDEVENNLKEFQGISFASVDYNVLQQGEIIAFYSSATGEPLPSEHIFSFLAERMSVQAIPRHLEFLEKVPLNAHGKADRSAIAAAFTNRLRNANNTNALAELWARYLPVQGLDASTDFFKAGGDSLSALNLAIDVERLTGKRLEPEFIARHSTFGTFCEMLALAPIYPRRDIADREGNPLFVFLEPLRTSKPSPFLHLAAAMHETSHLVLDYKHIFQDCPPATLKDFSRACAEQITKCEPLRVILVGHSAGGTAALDLAAQLEKLNVNVGTVIMLDSFTAGIRTALRAKRVLREIFKHAFWKRQLMRLTKFQVQSPANLVLSESSTSIFELGRHIGGWLEPVRVRPRLPKTARIVLYKADHESQPEHLRALRHNGWRRRIPRLEVRYLDADHASMLHQAYAPSLARLIFEESQA